MGPLRRFVHRYGWRAYALPVLTAVTVAVLVHPGRRLPPHVLAQDPPRPGQRPAGQHLLVGSANGPSSTPVVVNLPPLTDPTHCLGNTAPTLVLVSIGVQHAWMCQRGMQVYDTAVTTGASSHGDATPTGSWLVQAKQTDRYLTGPGYREFVHYWMPFNGDFGLHDAPWQTMHFGSPGYRIRGSNGCVHLPGPAMSWLYRWAQVGTTVTVRA